MNPSVKRSEDSQPTGQDSHVKKFYKTLQELDKDLEVKERDNGSGSSRKISQELMSRHHPQGE